MNRTFGSRVARSASGHIVQTSSRMRLFVFISVTLCFYLILQNRNLRRELSRGPFEVPFEGDGELSSRTWWWQRTSDDGSSILRRWFMRHDMGDSHTRLGFPPYVPKEVSKAPAEDKRAVVTTLYDNSYAVALRVLAYSLRKVQTRAKLVCLYIPGQVENSVKDAVSKAGWELVAVQRIPPPTRGTAEQFRDQFTKLRIWELTQFDALFYMDADTVAVRNFDEIWSVSTDFAAVPDVYLDERGFTLNFNAGVMFLRPSKEVFSDMIEQASVLRYEPSQAEQSFLNSYMRFSVWRIPYMYNGNLAIKRGFPLVWRSMLPTVAVIHYTLQKPFKLGEHDADGEFAPEFALWWKLRREMESNLSSSPSKTIDGSDENTRFLLKNSK